MREIVKHIQPKDTVLTMRLSGALLDKVKEQAKLKNMDYQKYIRLILEKNINKNINKNEEV